MCSRQSEADTVRLSPAQTKWLAGLKAGAGLTSQLSRMTTVGARPDLLPIVVSLSRGGGLSRFITTLATSYALKEDATGELMLMLSWGLTVLFCLWFAGHAMPTIRSLRSQGPAGRASSSAQPRHKR